MNIGIFNETEEELKELETINELMQYTLKYEKVENAEFNIIIIDNQRIKEINKEYRGIDKETDVISFALMDNDSCNTDDGILRLGDIYISIDKVKSQAKEYNHSEDREISFLAVHGLLHLLGYNHEEDEEKKVMRSLEEKILNECSIARE